MFVYEKKLQYPVKIKNCNPKLASIIISQYGGRYSNRLQLCTRGMSVTAHALVLILQADHPCAPRTKTPRQSGKPFHRDFSFPLSHP